MPGAFLFVAEKEGFKPPVPLTVHLISNQAHSITLTLLHGVVLRSAKIVFFAMLSRLNLKVSNTNLIASPVPDLPRHLLPGESSE
jgi:hypothetical protein